MSAQALYLFAHRHIYSCTASSETHSCTSRRLCNVSSCAFEWVLSVRHRLLSWLRSATLQTWWVWWFGQR